MPLRESGVGPYRHVADLANLADPDLSREHAQRVQSARKSADGNGWESAVLDAGFDGYISRANGMAVVLGRDVPVSRADAAPATPPAAAGRQTRTLLAREIADIEPRMADLQKAAPGARLRMGNITFDAADQAAVDRFLAEYAPGDREQARGYNPAAGIPPGDYTRLEGKIVEKRLALSDGREAILRVDSAQALRRLDERAESLERLRKCLGTR